MEFYPPTRKNESPIICKDMGGAVVHYLKLNKKGTKRQVLHYVTYKRTLASQSHRNSEYNEVENRMVVTSGRKELVDVNGGLISIKLQLCPSKTFFSANAQ